METLGSLLDKLTIIKLKEYHTSDAKQLSSLGSQGDLLKLEIDSFIAAAAAGTLPKTQLTFQANKVVNGAGDTSGDIYFPDISRTFSDLAETNCRLWHMQELIYDFKNVPVDEKDYVIISVAALNLRRNKDIDHINELFSNIIYK